MKKLLLLLVSFPVFVYSQNFEISGKLLEKETNIPLEAATVYIEKQADSSLITYTISDVEGFFELKGTAQDTMNLIISYTGFQPFKKVIAPNVGQLNLGNVYLESSENLLDEVKITARRAPVTVKNDTLEFNAASFKTRPNANLEDVLDELPGVQVDSDGNITVNGKPVSRILVNGKEFFGDDPKIATKNLPKEIIDKIQVVDTKTKAEEFTGKAGDTENKTINITIDEDKNKGFFARATAGGGTDERYELSGIGNYFRNDLRVSVLASSNNINSAGFSFDEVFDMMGRNGGGVRSISRSSNGSFGINGLNFGSNEGITKSETAGANFVNEWDDKVELSTNYFFGKNDTETHKIIEREVFLPESKYFYYSESAGNLENKSHRVSAAFEYEPDTLTRISYNPRFNANDGFSSRFSEASTTTQETGIITSTETFDNEEFSSRNFSSSLDFIRKFGARGAYLRFDLNNNNETTSNDNFYFSERDFIQEGTQEVLNQLIEEEQEENEYGGGLTYRAVLADDFFLDLSYDFEMLNATNKRYVLGYEETTETYSEFQELYSNDFKIKSNEHIPNAGLNYEGEKFRASAEAGAILTSLETEDILIEEASNSFSTSYENLFISTYMRYNFSKSASVYLNYRTSSDAPSIHQLQPVLVATDPLNRTIGNPELDPAYSHSFYGGYRNFDFASRSGFYSYFNLDLVENNIVPFVTTSEELVRTTTYVNIDGSINTYLGSFYNKTYQKETFDFNYRIGISGSYNKNRGFSQGIAYSSERFSIRPSVSFGYEIDDLISIDPSYSMNINSTNYNIGENREEDYTNHSFSLEMTTYWPENVVFGNDISYTYLGNIGSEFRNTALLWNASLGYQFLDDDATLKIKVYDLLNENISTQRIVGEDYVQDTNSLILEQYFMLSFTYKISKFGGKDPNENPMRMF